MSTEAVGNEIQAFYEFLGQRMDDPAITPERSVQEFRAYQEELRRAQAELRASHEEFRLGKAKPLDVDALMDRVRGRLAQQGRSR
jgi:hypothetical protein